MEGGAKGTAVPKLGRRLGLQFSLYLAAVSQYSPGSLPFTEPTPRNLRAEIGRTVQLINF
jgi:hypothetical protein